MADWPLRGEGCAPEMGTLDQDSPTPPVLFSHHRSPKSRPVSFNCARAPPKTIILLLLGSSTAECEYLGSGPELVHCWAVRHTENVVSRAQREAAVPGIIDRLFV